MSILTVTGLRKQFKLRGLGGRTLTAVDNVSFEIARGETLALVGESGSGKSTLARCVTRLIEPTAGSVVLDGQSLTAVSRRELPRIYQRIQMVFQDPTSSLDPLRTVRATLDEPLRLHTDMDKRQREDRIRELLNDVELSEVLIDRLPRQLSGGQRQRLGIARALAANSEVLILDEPTASLDVSIRGQIIALLERLQRERGLAYLLISHDIAVVRKISHRVMVMYLGGIVEEGPTDAVFDAPMHPYTRSLISAAPVAEYGRVKTRVKLQGEIPSPVDLPPGCRLVGRCPLATPDCAVARPSLQIVGEGHLAACPVIAPTPAQASV